MSDRIATRLVQMIRLLFGGDGTTIFGFKVSAICPGEKCGRRSRGFVCSVSLVMHTSRHPRFCSKATTISGNMSKAVRCVYLQHMQLTGTAAGLELDLRRSYLGIDFAVMSYVRTALAGVFASIQVLHPRGEPWGFSTFTVSKCPGGWVGGRLRVNAFNPECLPSCDFRTVPTYGNRVVLLPSYLMVASRDRDIVVQLNFTSRNLYPCQLR